MAISTRFTSVASVEVWDTHFRWREDDALRDLTIDDTWRRVAESVSDPSRGPWARRYAEAFSRWLLLPGEALLQRGGTWTVPQLQEGCSAVVNAHAFVRRDAAGATRIEHGRLADTAALAVRFVDDGAVRFDTGGNRIAPRVGLFGVGDALAALGLAYDSEDGRRTAADIAASLASGCLAANRALRHERGPWVSLPHQPFATLLRRGNAPAHESLRESPLRHDRITAIFPQPRVAMLANGTSDALRPAGTDVCTSDACRRMQAAVQPWIDTPIADACSAG